MKILSIFLLLSFFACNTKESSFLNDKTAIKNTINTHLDDWHEAAADAEFKPYFSLFSDSGIYIGTDSKEIWTVEAFKSFSKPYFNKGKAWSFKATDRNIYLSKNQNIVWFDEALDTWMGICRGSGVFQKYGEEWKLEHYVLSLAVPNEKMDSVIAVIQ